MRLLRFLKILLISPRYVINRVVREVLMEIDRWRLPAICRFLTPTRLALRLGYDSIDAAWTALALQPFPFVVDSVAALKFVDSSARCEITSRAKKAMLRQVDILGSGTVTLGSPVDWHADPKVGHRWSPTFCRRIKYTNQELPSDVKIPWEISRLQWLIPVGQAYILDQNEAYANFVRQILEEWIDSNPVAFSVNWSCTMEPAIRTFTWVWLFNVFESSAAWNSNSFRTKFLRMLFLHGLFIERHIECARINGNHYTADAAGLTWAGLFFHRARHAKRWKEMGWEILESEILVQVHPDGVDFEAASAYHRLVAEFFWIAAHYRKSFGLLPSQDYISRLAAMIDVTNHISRPDGSTPNWGDADDGRALPLGVQNLGDHRYLIDLISNSFLDQTGVSAFNGSEYETYWVFGALSATNPTPTASKAFPYGGLFILQDDRAHVAIDCGPIGLSGLGGHGHNDALSFEYWCEGHSLVVDSGTYVYTADFAARNRFRSTSSHNTPQVNNFEINRFYDSSNLWNLHDDAKAELIEFESDGDIHRLLGRHYGYERLKARVSVEREFVLDSKCRSLTIEDRFRVLGSPVGLEVRIPLHLAPGVVPTLEQSTGTTELRSKGKVYTIEVHGPSTGIRKIVPTLISPSYGLVKDSFKFIYKTPLKDKLSVRMVIGLKV